ncbi:MAG: 2-oxoacid:acceptor oxidoreductase subunit alpha [Candidatus Eisenbacteria bacterium]|uniref:2-oxoacid:acceptor oxidoreductase subunit alpha n=1 Tax=Eiseniibacteriota bacterium TaxID=2212470 RepID=A0A948W2K7_UNCEI|nr:2-oxoacid:acceptor oxidoreductase subunit alpha [Candidatus Eisenbacteria bacterium]MBU2690067.1 2-oxoacid:acceptor oxidoreductase subunit alpha [Candidatus Eisenbacteria bacterium]
MSQKKREASTKNRDPQRPEVTPTEKNPEKKSPASDGPSRPRKEPQRHQPTREQRDHVVLRLAGDSGDGMQLTGNQFTRTSALFGNDVATLPDYPSEIRAPKGTLPGVSAFQINFSSLDIHTPGDRPDVLVAMNPAALRVNLTDLEPGAIIVANTGTFIEREFKKAGYTTNPLEDGSLDGFRVISVDISYLTNQALQEIDLSTQVKDSCKNFFALGLMYWLFNRPMTATESWIKEKFKPTPTLCEANLRALQAGWAYGEATELFQNTYEVPPTVLPPGKYRNINGNSAVALGLIAAAQKSGRPLFYGSYPITPASDILHELSRYKKYDVLTFQAEDEIAAMCSTIGAAFGGSIAATATSGPGLDLKEESIGLAYIMELPIVIINVQRGGPSTGLPTKTEQSDLLTAIYGRHGDADLPVIAASSPPELFHMTYEAVRLAVKYMTPIILLSDGYLANGAEPWNIPKYKDLPPIKVNFRTDPEGFQPYLRDPITLSRPWVVPGTPGMEHRVGGLERDAETGSVSQDPLNHEKMSKLRADKVMRIADDIPPAVVEGSQEGDILIVSWGSTYGPIQSIVQQFVDGGDTVGHVNLRYLNPFQKNLGEILKRFKRVLVFELNFGQLCLLLRGRFLIDARSYTKVQGQPFKQFEIHRAIERELKDMRAGKGAAK